MKPLLSIDLDAIARNLERVRAFFPQADIAPVLKGDAYGLGAAPVARRLARMGIRRFWVETLEEGLALRAALRQAPAQDRAGSGLHSPPPPADGQASRGLALRRPPANDRTRFSQTSGEGPDVDELAIGVLDGPGPGEAGAFAEAWLQPLVADRDQLEAWLPHAASGPPCALGIETGFNRLGFREADWPVLAAALKGGLRARAWLTHFANGPEGPEDARNRLQEAAALRARAALGALPLSLGLDAAVAERGRLEPAEIRSGAALFGVEVFPELLPLETVVRLEAPMLAVANLAAGERVGYGSGWVATRPSRIATLGIGYGQGLPRSLGDAGKVFFGEGPEALAAPIVGAVSMGLIACDVTGLPEYATAPGTRGRLLDQSYTINEMARDARRLDTEILCAFARTPRDYRSL